MLNWIRFVVFGGGGAALEFRIAWRSEPVPVSLVLVTVKVIAGVGVGVGVGVAVGVAPGASPLSTGGEVERVVPWPAVAVRRRLNALAKVGASTIEKIDKKAIASVIRSAKARAGLFFFILFFGGGDLGFIGVERAGITPSSTERQAKNLRKMRVRSGLTMHVRYGLTR